MISRRTIWAAALLLFAVGPDVRAAELSISSQPPGATVFIDAEFAGVTPFTTSDLTPGEHNVRLARHGYQAWQTSIKIADEPVTVEAKLQQVPKLSLEVTSEPPGAEIYLDGEPVGRTPLALHDLEPGEYELRVQKANCEPAERTVELTGPEPSVEHFQLSLRTEQFYLGEIESHPEEISNYTELAHLYLLNDDVDKAIDVFRKAILAGTAQGADRNDVRYLYKTLTSAYRGNYSKGDREKEKQTQDKLEVIVEEAIEKAPRDSGEYRSLAMVYTSLVPLEKIAALCDRIAQGNPDSTIYQDMGDIYLERGKAADAIVMFEQAITRGPDNFKTRYALATAYHRVGRYEKAQQQYEAAQAIDAPPREKAELLFMFSRLHRKTGDLEKAEQALRSATELAPDSDQSGRWALQLVDVLIEQKKFNEAEKMCTDLAAAGKNPYLKRRAQQRLQRITNERRNEGK